MTYQYMDPLKAYDREMMMLAKRHAPFKVHLPEGQSGDWTVERMTVHADIQALRFWRDGRAVPPGDDYTRLRKKGTGVFMTDTPAELQDARPLLARASGHVLISGLGIGMIPRALLMDRFGAGRVTRITILEKEPDVIKLVAPHVANDKIEIVEADAFTWEPPADAKFDWAWHDIWPDMCSDYKPEMAALRRRYGRFMSKPRRQLCWGEHGL
jgi:hypothetical protein